MVTEALKNTLTTECHGLGPKLLEQLVIAIERSIRIDKAEEEGDRILDDHELDPPPAGPTLFSPQEVDKADIHDDGKCVTPLEGSVLPRTKEADRYFLTELLLLLKDEEDARFLASYASNPPDGQLFPKRLEMDTPTLEAAITALRKNSDTNRRIIQKALAELESCREP